MLGLGGLLGGLARGGARAVPRMAGKMPKALLKPGAVKASPSAVSQLGSAGLPTAAAAPAAAAAKGGGLLGGALRFAGSPVGQLGIAGVTLAPFVASMRSGVIDDLTTQGRGLGGQYDKGPLGVYNLLGLPSDDALDARRSNYLERELGAEMALLQRGGLGAEAVVDPNKSLSQNRANLSSFIDEAQFNIDERRAKRNYFGDVASARRAREDVEREAQRGLLQLQLNQAHEARMDALQEKIDSRVGQQDLQRLQLMGMQDTNREKMDLYRQELNQKAQADRYRTTASLISGLSQLGAAFVL